MKSICLSVALILSAGPAFAAKESPEERAVWRLEQSYWKYVQAGDLESYRNLWHPNFVGWPESSATPKKKDHITDWIANYTKKGLHLKSYRLEPAASQATGEVVVTHYWISDRWVDKDGHVADDKPSRITHTWIRTPGGWQIIGGMCGSLPDVVPAQRAPVVATRIYTGPDGQSHAEEINLKLAPGGGSAELSEMLKATGAQFRRQAPNYFEDWHTAPRRQYVITLSGRGEIEVSGGKKVPLGPGTILLVEDLTGKGHISRGVGAEDRISVIIPLAE